MKSHEATEKKDLFIELRGFKGMSLDAVCSELSISKTTAMEWEKKFKGYIIQTRAAHFDFLVDSYCLSLEKRLFELKEISEKLRIEISKRDMHDVPSDKLIQLQLETFKRTSEFIERFSLKESITEMKLDFLDF